MGVVSYLTIDGEILSETRDGVERDYLPDSLGSTIGLLDNTQTLTDAWTYWPYGEVASRTGTNSTPMQFVGTRGCRQDSSSRDYMRGRIEALDLTRWQTAERQNSVAGVYVYARTRPTVLIDPDPKRLKRSPTPPRGPVDIELAGDMCGQGNPIACKLINDQLPPCTSSSPNYQACGSLIIGTNPGLGGNANKSNWPAPICQLKFLPPPLCDLGGEFCCMECMMRVCCFFGPGAPPDWPPASVPAPLPKPVPGPIWPGMPVLRPGGGYGPIE